MSFINVIISNWGEIAKAMAMVIGVASIIVRITPTIKDNEVLERIIKIIGKYIALNRNGTDDEEARAEAARLAALKK